MNCQEARLLLSFARPYAADLDAADRQSLDAHLAGCPACTTIVQRERQFDDRVLQAMRNVPIPDGLKNRLLTRLANERNAFHRQRVGYLAAAAALLLATSVVWFVMAHRSRTVDLNEFAARTSAKDPEQIVERLRQDANLPDLEFPQELVERWDFSLLIEHRAEMFNGQAVPTLVFRKGDTVAKVSLLRTDKVDLRGFDPSYSPNIHVLSDPGGGRYIALVVIEGGKQKYSDFLKPGTSPRT